MTVGPVTAGLVANGEHPVSGGTTRPVAGAPWNFHPDVIPVTVGGYPVNLDIDASCLGSLRVKLSCVYCAIESRVCSCNLDIQTSEAGLFEIPLSLVNVILTLG